MKFGDELKRLRIDRGFSFRELAKENQIDPANLCAIEKGKLWPPATMKTLRKIIKPLKLHNDEIYVLSELAIQELQQRIVDKFYGVKSK